MKNILIDTDVLINFLRGKESARDYLISLQDEVTACCSVITVAEIHAGMKEHERPMTDELIDSLTLVDINRDIAEKAGLYKREEKKQFLELPDCLIAASAFVIGADLATSNGKHYPMDDIKKIIVK